MVFEVPASKASIKQNQFEFKVPGEKKTRALPLLKFLPVGTNSKMAELAAPIKKAKDAGNEPDRESLQAFGVFQIGLLEKYSPGVTDVLDNEQLKELLGGWQEASGISVGESPASAGS